MKSKFSVSKEKKEVLINSIKEYFYKERDEDLGDLSAAMILDFFMEDLAVEFYNQGVMDAYKYMNDRVEDMLGLQK